MTPLLRLVDAWSHLAVRERRLALVVGALTACLILLLIGKGAYQALDNLDREIGRLSNEILNSTRQKALREGVAARFTQVANQHSSDWSESEIRDRLRQEIYRLSNLEPPALDAQGIPLSTNNESGLLVEIPELGSGRLVEGGEGFREYQIEFSIRPVPLPALTGYLERLLESPQSLRIDRIDLRRDPERTEFAANLVITRTVLDTRGGVASLPITTAGWTCEGCEVGVEVISGQEPTLVLRGTEAGGTASLERHLSSGVFDVVLEMASTSDGRVGVVADGAALKCEGDSVIKADGHFYRYRFQVALPQRGDTMAVQIPYLTWTQPDATLRIRGIQVTPASEVAHGV
jgi:type II secretory pathway component PulM